MKQQKKKKPFLVVVITLIAVVILIASATAIYSFRKVEPQEVTYGLSDEENLYSELPDKPSDFHIYKREISSGRFNDLCKVDYDYYIQPEFYPRWDIIKERDYINHDYTRWGVHGYGSYPADMGWSGVRNLKKGDVLEVCTFLQTGWNIETWQGVYLRTLSNEYFDVQIKQQEYEEFENHFLLEPTFPEFSDGWVKRIDLIITVKQDVPKGDYKLGFDVEQPDGRFNDKMFWEVVFSGDINLDQTYLKDCVDKIINESVSNGYLKAKDKCSKYLQSTEKTYIPGGSIKISRETYLFSLGVD